MVIQLPLMTSTCWQPARRNYCKVGEERHQEGGGPGGPCGPCGPGGPCGPRGPGGPCGPRGPRGPCGLEADPKQQLPQSTTWPQNRQQKLEKKNQNRGKCRRREMK
ncbi:hypothetical protein Drorol1_Dr00024820 [Drosera rotundifolia]